MNSTRKKREEASDKNSQSKEDTMKKRATGRKRITRGTLLVALAAGFLIILTALIAQPIMAKPRGWFSTARSADEIVQTLSDRLDLTADQTEEIRAIIEEKVRKRNEIRDNAASDRSTIRAEMQKLRWDTEMKLTDILDDEQIDRYFQLRQEQRGRFRSGKARGGWLGRGFNKDPEQVVERLSARLNLTEEQALAIQPVIEESIEKRREVFERYQGQGQDTRQSLRDEMQAIGDETHGQLSLILNDEQMEKLDAMRDDRRARRDKWMDCPGPRGF